MHRSLLEFYLVRVWAHAHCKLSASRQQACQRSCQRSASWTLLPLRLLIFVAYVLGLHIYCHPLLYSDYGGVIVPPKRRPNNIMITLDASLYYSLRSIWKHKLNWYWTRIMCVKSLYGNVLEWVRAAELSNRKQRMINSKTCQTVGFPLHIEKVLDIYVAESSSYFTVWLTQKAAMLHSQVLWANPYKWLYVCCVTEALPLTHRNTRYILY